MSKAKWALFCDADFMFRADLAGLFAEANPRYACQVVKHEYAPQEALKMDQQVQTSYPKKGWSALCLWNMSHAANLTGRFTVGMLNEMTGLELQQFAWLHPHEIGELSQDWHVLETGQDLDINPKGLHLTRGTPDMIEVPKRWAAEWWGYTTSRDLSLTTRLDGATAQ